MAEQEAVLGGEEGVAAAAREVAAKAAAGEGGEQWAADTTVQGRWVEDATVQGRWVEDATEGVETAGMATVDTVDTPGR